MWKRSSLLQVAVVALAVAANAQAQVTLPAIEDCGVLADAVYGEVVASGLFGGYRLAPEPARGEPASCSQTANSVASGFSRAMAAINIYVAWSTPSDRPGDTCLSNDLAQCHPVRSPFVPGGGWDALDVSATWQVVVDVVSKTMPLGTASDYRQFYEYDLRLRLNDSLSNRFVTFGGPVQASPKR